MSGSNSAVETGRRSNPLPFLALVILALGLGAFALYKGEAPIRSIDPYNWGLWAKGASTWAGVLAIAVVVLLIGVIGLFRAVFAPQTGKQPDRIASRAIPADIELSAAPAIDVQSATRASEARGSLHFNANRVNAAASDLHVAGVLVEPPSVEIQSLEPAVFTDHAAFSDNASDSFMTRKAEPAEVPAFDANAALNETHGLHISGAPAQIIPFPEPSAEPVHDPLAAALLAETPDVVTHAPQGDINAVINSAMRFAPQSEIIADAAPAYVPTQVVREIIADVVPAPVAEPAQAAPAPVHDDEGEIRQAVQTALSVWPDATRAIAADELSVRISHLYYDKAPLSQKAFHLIASGDLSAAASTLASHADALTQSGNTIAAAELWRVSGALHMGRDDAKALAAYERVSELDPADANIHLYLARRYQMAGDTAKQPAVIGRALGVISDPDTRAELLAPYADFKLKAGDAKAAGDAFEELSRLHESNAYLRPDDVGARSAHAITVARLAQAREMQGAFDVAGPLYKKAHQAFADLSALKPEHPGLRAMADNALKDAQRFNLA